MTTRLMLTVTESPVKQEILNTAPYWHVLPASLDFTSVIVDLIHQYAAQVSYRALVRRVVSQKDS